MNIDGHNVTIVVPLTDELWLPENKNLRKLYVDRCILRQTEHLRARIKESGGIPVAEVIDKDDLPFSVFV